MFLGFSFVRQGVYNSGGEHDRMFTQGSFVSLRTNIFIAQAQLCKGIRTLQQTFYMRISSEFSQFLIKGNILKFLTVAQGLIQITLKL